MATAKTPPVGGQGVRLFTCGHSFHWWVGPILEELAASAGIAGHRTVGCSSIGGSRTIQHWEVPEEKNEVKKALRAGAVDVLTLACMTHPDEGIRLFAELAAEHNPQVRVTLQELWLPEDRFPFEPNAQTRTSVEQFNGSTPETLAPPLAAYAREMDGFAAAVNADLGRPVIFIVPDGQATLKLRTKICAGQVPALRRQSALFTDSWGHPQPPLQLLSAYCHFAVIYRRDPAGLPWPKVVACAQQGDAQLNADLQRFAWEAVTEHPMSGVGRG